MKINLNSIMRYLPGFIFWKDKNSVFLGCNENFARAAGIGSAQEIVGKTDYDLAWGKTEGELFRKGDLEVLAGHEKHNVEESQLMADGKHATVLVNKVALLDENKNPIGILCSYSDITERKQMEQEAEQLRTEKTVLTEQEEVTRLLAASMAHELRTPLRSIESGAEGIEKFLPQLLQTYQVAREAGLEIPYIAPVHQKALANIAKNIEMETRSAFSVIDMLLVKTKLSHLDQEKFKTSSIAHCVEEALARYPLHPEEVEKIHWQKGDFSFFGDELIMTHVIFNLLKNALHYIKATSKGEIQIWCDKNEKFNILHFKDTSQGIDPEILPHIFDRFYTRTHHGTGVGLAFCKLVMQSFGGDITCTSVKGEYSDFTLSFPVNSKE